MTGRLYFGLKLAAHNAFKTSALGFVETSPVLQFLLLVKRKPQIIRNAVALHIGALTPGPYASALA